MLELTDNFYRVTDSQVYSPEDGDLWALAKESFQVTDFAYVEMVEHLLKTHLMMEPFCVCVLRHLSKLHPLHQLLKYHCRYEELLREVTWGFVDFAGKGKARACDWL